MITWSICSKWKWLQKMTTARKMKARARTKILKIWMKKSNCNSNSYYNNSNNKCSNSNKLTSRRLSIMASCRQHNRCKKKAKKRRKKAKVRKKIMMTRMNKCPWTEVVRSLLKKRRRARKLHLIKKVRMMKSMRRWLRPTPTNSNACKKKRRKKRTKAR
jgi:hypothetical protein